MAGGDIPGDVTVLVVAKAPVAGYAKTRLAASVGTHGAAAVAAASLLDTIDVCTQAAGPGRCRLALAGELDDAVESAAIRRALRGWTVVPQQGDTFGERLAHAHAGVGGPVVQIGMDTPQVTGELLAEAAEGLARHDAVLGPAEDGGWWTLALRDSGRASAITDVPMSTPTTCADTHAALEAEGLSVRRISTLRDVDRMADLAAVAARAPGGRFAWAVGGLLAEAAR